MRQVYSARILVRTLSVMLLALIVGCSAESPLPTAIVLPSLTPTLAPSASPTVTKTPAPNTTPTPAPTEFFGRTVQGGPGKGQVRVMNLTPDSAPLDFYLNRTPLATGLRPTYVSGQTPILPGTYIASLNPDGTGTTLSLTVTADQNLDLLVVGTGDTRQIIVISQPAAPVRAGEVWLSFANALPDVGEITLTLDDSTSLTLNGFSASTPSIAASGERVLRATVGGQVLLEQVISLRELTLYTFILADSLTNPGTVQLQRLESPVLGRYSVRVINLSAESREVDLYLNDIQMAEAIGFGDSAAPQEVVTGSQRLSVYSAGADRAASAPLVDQYIFSGQAGTSLILILTGSASAVQIASLEDKLEPVPEGSSRVLFFNATEGVTGLVAGRNGENLADFRPLALGQFSPARLLDGGDIRFTFTDANNPDLGVFEDKLIPLPAGQTLLYAVTGREDVLFPIYGYPVEQSAALTAEGTTIPQSRLRFVNGLAAGVAVDVYVNGILSIPALISPAGGPLSPIIGEDFTLLVRQAGDGPALLDLRLGIPSPGDYSVFIYGDPTEGLQATLVKDDALRIADDIGTLRLVNLSGDPVDIYSLSYYAYPPDVTPIAPTATPFPSPTPVVNPLFPVTPEPTQEPFTAPLDVRRIIRDAKPRTASSQTIAPQGLFDLTLIDSNGRILGGLSALQIPIGQHYDIVAYTYRTANGTKTELFIAPYPPR